MCIYTEISDKEIQTNQTLSNHYPGINMLAKSQWVVHRMSIFQGQ